MTVKRKPTCVEECFETRRHYSQFALLGEGSSGSVYKATEIRTGKPVAIKRLKSVFEDPTNAKRVLRELRLLHLLQGNHGIVGFLGILKPEKLEDFCDLFLVFDYYDSDMDKLRQRPAPFAQYFDNYQIQCLMYQLLISIKYMHSQRVIHRDLKPGNLLVNANCSLVVCDFGLARLLPIPIVPPKSPLVVAFGLVRTAVCRAFGMGCKRSRVASSTGATIRKENLKEEFFSPLPSPSQPQSSQVNLASPFLPSITENNREDQTHQDNGLDLGPLPLVRAMTRHVVTRHYRAPEVQLAQDYTTSIDLWAAGCILADLLGMQRESGDVSERHALFPGASSGFTAGASGDNEQDERNAQLNAIFDVRGTPEAEELFRVCTVRDAETNAYITTLLGSPHPPKDLRALYPGADPLAIDLLQSLLQFDPGKRPSAQQALMHPYLQCIRDSKILTRSYGRYDEQIANMSSTVDFDFEEDQELSLPKLRAMIVSEIRLYNP